MENLFHDRLTMQQSDRLKPVLHTFQQQFEIATGLGGAAAERASERFEAGLCGGHLLRRGDQFQLEKVTEPGDGIEGDLDVIAIPCEPT